MRILANFSSRVNGESFSVSFETMGDVPKDQADSVVDDLFAKARAAVQRQQVKPEGPTEAVQSTKDNTGNGNGGNGGNGKLDPSFMPATKKQQYTIGNLLSGLNSDFQKSIFKSCLGRDIKSYEEIGKYDATKLITLLLDNTLKLEDMRV